MELIAITGSIASGKSHLRRALARQGLPTLDSDVVGHGLLSGTLGDGSVARRVVAQFPEAANTGADGLRVIDRQRLGSMVFGQPAQLKKLEAILHPAIRQEIQRWARTQRRLGFKQAAVEVPLLFEAGFERMFDRIIITHASHFEIRRRAMQRPGMTEKKLREILARQWSYERKTAYKKQKNLL